MAEPGGAPGDGARSSTERPGVLLFRRRLLPWSETFIANQGRALQRWRGTFVGFDLVEAGERYLAGADRVVLAEHSALAPLAKAAVKTVGWLPPGWRRGLARRRPVLVHAHFGNNAHDARALADHFGVPLLVTFWGADISVHAGRRRSRRRARLFDTADRVLACSGFIADRLVEAGCPPERITVHHVGVDTARFRPGPPRERAEAQVLFVGRLVEKKGVRHLLRAMALVSRRIRGAELVVVGDGPLRGELERAAEADRVRVRFVGVETPDRVVERMRRAALLCTPSVEAANGDQEGLPLVVMEAQASGLPVVLSPSGGSLEGIADGETGLAAPCGDADTLAAHLVTLLADGALRRRFSDAARARALERFDLARQTERLEAIYDEVAGR